MISIETAVESAPGISAMPVSNAVKPRIDWKKSGKISAVPNRPKPMMMPRNEPTENERNLKTRRSTIGCLSRSALQHERDQRDHGDDGEEQDRLRLEPVVALALLEHVLQRRQARREQPEPDPVDAALGLRDVLAGSG